MCKSPKNFRTLLYLGLHLSLCLALVACSGGDKDKDVAASPATTQKQLLTSSVDRLMQWPEKDLRARARKTRVEQFAPNGVIAFQA